jgi:competence protein ComEC
MIKRPLIWILLAYLLGVLLAWYHCTIWIIGIVVVFSCLLIMLLMFYFTGKVVNKSDSFLWTLPLLLLLGYGVMFDQCMEPELSKYVEQEADCKVTGKISMIVDKSWGVVIHVRNNSITLKQGSSYWSENMVIYSLEPTKYRVGNRIEVHGTLQKFLKASNPGQFNEYLYYQTLNIDYKVSAKVITLIDANYSRFHHLLRQIKQRLTFIYENLLSEKEAGALITMLLGDNYLLDEEIKQLYQENGISHVLAISGLHISLIGMTIFYLLKRLKLPLYLVTLLSIFFIYGYGVMTNFSVSTNRSIVMMTILLLSNLIGKTYDMLSATALSAFLILLQNPMQIMSAGFLLSFGAVIGIAILLPCFQKLFPTMNSTMKAICVSISAQVSTTPFVLYFFYQFPIYSIAINLIILPCVTLLMLTSLVAGIAGIIYLPLGVFIIGGANYILKFYEWVCRIGSSAPGSVITIGRPDLLRLLLYGGIIALFIWISSRYKRKSSILLILFATVFLMMPERNIGLELTMLDVGQGEGIFMKSKAGTTYLIDGGSTDIKRVGKYRIEPFLLSQGIAELDYIVITHSDFDHISGIRELIEGSKIKINNLILPQIKEKDEAYQQLEELVRRYYITLIYIKKGDILQDGDIRITCLNPNPDYSYSTVNAYSTVLSITYGDFDMLLTGDLEKDGEKMVMHLLQEQTKASIINDNEGFATDYEVLKVAHHGSRNSTLKEILHIIKPEISLISSGANNRYRHPHKELIDRLLDVNSNIETTMERGAITIKTDGHYMELYFYK